MILFIICQATEISFDINIKLYVIFYDLIIQMFYLLNVEAHANYPFIWDKQKFINEFLVNREWNVS